MLTSDSLQLSLFITCRGKYVGDQERTPHREEEDPQPMTTFHAPETTETSGMPNTTSGPRIVDGPTLWPAQAQAPSVLGRQLVIDRGEGAYVYTTDGRRLFDGTA